MTDDVLKYCAFLSYSQQDNLEKRPDAHDVTHLCWGDWLHAALKDFSIPAEFVGHLNSRGEPTPERIESIFQDTHEQSGEAALSAETRRALEQSKCLVVICSPRSAASLHVNEVVRYFKQLGRGKNIFPIVIAGEPNVSDTNKPGDECFVPALRHPVRPDGTLDTARRPGKYIVVDARHGAGKREITANDHRNAEADLEMARIQLIALLAGVAFNGLWWREQKRHFLDLADARQQAREALDQVTEARRQLSEAERQTHEAQKQILEVQNLPRDVHGQIQEAQTKAAAAQEQVREAQRQLQEFQNKARDTQAQLEEARNRVLTVESKCLEAQNQARETQRQVEDAHRQLQEAKSQVELRAQTVPGEIQEAQRQAEEARRQIQELQNQFQQAQAQAQEARSQAEAAQRQLQEARNQPQVQAVPVETPEAQRRAEESHRQIEELQSQTQQAGTQAQAARIEVEAAQNESRQARRLTKILALVTLIALFAAGIAWWQRKVTSPDIAKSAPDEPKGSDSTRSKMDAEQIRQALQTFAAIQPGADRSKSLDELAARIPPQETADALKASSIILDDQQRNFFQLAVLDRNLPALIADNPTNTLALLNDLKPAPGQESYALLFQHWATNNPVQAIEQRQQAPGHDEDDKILCTIMAAWMEKQPDTALNWLQAQPDSDSKNKALETCVWKLAETDAPKALTLAKSLPEGTWRNMVIARLFDDWTAKDLDAATTAYQQLPEGTSKTKAWELILSHRIKKDPAAAVGDVTNLPAGDFRQMALQELCDRWAGTNAPAALAWAQTLPSAVEQADATNQIVIAWAGKDPQAAVAFTDQHPELSGNVIWEVATACAQTDLAAATNWVSRLPDGERKDTVLLAMSGAWAQADPKAMATYALTLPAGDVQTRCLTTACPPLAARDLPGTIELLKPLSDDGLRQTLLEQVARDCDLLHLDQAAKYIAAMPPGDDQQAAIKGLLATWTQGDPEAAANWLGAFPENNPQTNQVQSVIKAWSQTAPAAAAGWLTNSPAAMINETIVSAFLEGTLEKYPEFAAQWTTSVTNEASRQKYQVYVAKRWMQTDPSAATNWLNGLDLPDKLKRLK